jgi:succinate dehydrogenase / fumarate reductase iron-sulfur subunit
MPIYSFRIARSGASAAAGVTVNKSYSVELDERMTVLDGLFKIQREHDATLAFRCSCRVGMCGTCAMVVNYQPKLASQTRVATLDSNVVHVGPLEHLPVIKDLAVSLEPFFDKWKQIKPALHPARQNSKELAIVPPDSEFGREAQGKRDCITCGACYSACGITETNPSYLGPAAINRAMLRLMDPRDDHVDQRLKVLNDENGVWRCHTQLNCVAACPKNINLTDSIMKMKRSLLFPKKFHDKRNLVKAS